MKHITEVYHEFLHSCIDHRRTSRSRQKRQPDNLLKSLFRRFMAGNFVLQAPHASLFTHDWPKKRKCCKYAECRLNCRNCRCMKNKGKRDGEERRNKHSTGVNWIMRVNNNERNDGWRDSSSNLELHLWNAKILRLGHNHGFSAR